MRHQMYALHCGDHCAFSHNPPNVISIYEQMNYLSGTCKGIAVQNDISKEKCILQTSKFISECRNVALHYLL